MAAIPSAKHSTETKVDTDQYIVPALRRGMAILRLFKPDRRVIALPEIVRELGMTRATAFRLVYTLEADGYLKRAWSRWRVRSLKTSETVQTPRPTWVFRTVGRLFMCSRRHRATGYAATSRWARACRFTLPRSVMR